MVCQMICYHVSIALSIDYFSQVITFCGQYLTLYTINNIAYKYLDNHLFDNKFGKNNKNALLFSHFFGMSKISLCQNIVILLVIGLLMSSTEI